MESQSLRHGWIAKLFRAADSFERSRAVIDEKTSVASFKKNSQIDRHGIELSSRCKDNENLQWMIQLPG